MRAPSLARRRGRARWQMHAALAAVLFLLSACNRGTAQEPEPSRSGGAPSSVTAAPSARAPREPRALSARLARPAPPRLVAIGDLHGDLDHARRALRLAGAIDAHDKWVGASLVVVQTGDEVDRGDDDRGVVDLLEDLKKQAPVAGGELIALLGNHEIMNASLDFRYVTGAGFATFSLFALPDAASPPSAPPEGRGRAAAFAPGGSYAALFTRHPLMVKVGDSVFVHGGILPKHVAYGLDRMNDEVADWLARKRPEPPAIVVAEDGPVWTRAYSSEDSAPDCSDLRTALTELGATRMVVGHTVQRSGINRACDGAVWRIDVGLSRFYGGPIEALEIRKDDVSVLRETKGEERTDASDRR